MSLKQALPIIVVVALVAAIVAIDRIGWFP